MPETVRFWLDNKLCDGSKSAGIGEQLLVEYREKYYVVVDGVTQMKGSKPLCYSKLSIPTEWRMAMGAAPASHAAPRGDTAGEAAGPAAGSAEKVAGVPPSPAEDGQLPERPARPSATAKASDRSPQQSGSKPARPAGKTEPLQLAQEFVEAKCPYCGHRNEIVLDRNRRARPFFQPCDKCGGEFAVKLVQVLAYQAQVAGFR